MPTLSTSKLRADIRYLAAIDTRHRFLRPEKKGGVKESWFDNNAFIILTERADDGTPLVGVMLKHPSTCPVDKTATMQIKYWVANLKRPDDLDAAFKANIAAINTKMAELGVERVWGAIPKAADHLTERLNPVALAGHCERIDGAGVLRDNEGRHPYENFWFFIGDRTDVNDAVQDGIMREAQRE